MFKGIIGLYIHTKYITINRTRIITSKDYRENIHKYGMRYLFNLEYRKRCNLTERRRRNRIKRRFYKTTAQKNAIREYCSNKQNNRCFWCGNSFRTNDTKTIDHILPISIGGKHKMSNYRIIHESCRIERDKIVSELII